MLVSWKYPGILIIDKANGGRDRERDRRPIQPGGTGGIFAQSDGEYMLERPIREHYCIYNAGRLINI